MMRLELVRDWMTRNVKTVHPSLPLAEADKLLRSHAIRRLPVIENGRLVGIVTLGDIREARLLSQAIVAEIMTQNPVTISQDATVGEAAQTLLAHKIGGLPVVDHDRNLVGIITESDIFRLVVHDWNRASDDSVEPYSHYGG